MQDRLGIHSPCTQTQPSTFEHSCTSASHVCLPLNLLIQPSKLKMSSTVSSCVFFQIHTVVLRDKGEQMLLNASVRWAFFLPVLEWIHTKSLYIFDFLCPLQKKSSFMAKIKKYFPLFPVITVEEIKSLYFDFEITWELKINSIDGIRVDIV